MASTKASAATEAAASNSNAVDIVNTVVEDGARVGVERFFTIPGRDPFEEVEWEIRDAFIPGKDKPAFDQKDVEFPKFWSQTATNIVAQKYFRGRMGSPERESSVKQMIGRVVDTIGGWGRAGGYFATDEEADTFEAELKAILVNQLASFNSPVWFNVGFDERSFDRFTPEPEPPRKMTPSRRIQSRIDSIESSTERMKQAEHCGVSSKPTLNQTGLLKAAYWFTRIAFSSASKVSASSSLAK